MKKNERTAGLQRHVDRLTLERYDITLTEAHERGVCVKCKKSALERCSTDLGKQEYTISGFCEICFDGLMDEE